MNVTLLDTYLDAAIAMGGALNQVWGFYTTVILGVLGGVILSPALRPPQPPGRVTLIVLGLAAFMAMNFVAVAGNSARLDYLLQLAGEQAGRGDVQLNVFRGPLSFVPTKDNPFAFDYTSSLIVHLAIDACVLIALAWVLLADGVRHAALKRPTGMGAAP